MTQIAVIGRAEKASLVDLGVNNVPVKIDTGADTSSIWAHVVVASEDDDSLSVVFFDEGSPFYSGDVHIFHAHEYAITRVANSFGDREIRYKIKLRIKVKGKLIKGTFTLSDRSRKIYPILIGRRLLAGKFLVDVTKGEPLLAKEKERREQLQRYINVIRGDDSL